MSNTELTESQISDMIECIESLPPRDLTAWEKEFRDSIVSKYHARSESVEWVSAKQLACIVKIYNKFDWEDETLEDGDAVTDLTKKQWSVDDDDIPF